MTLRDSAHLEDILVSARLAVAYLDGVTREEFAASVQLQDAVLRRLAIIGEAARSVADRASIDMPDVPWRKIVNMRNFIVHEYRDVDSDIVWTTVREQLPIVIASIERYRGSGA